MKNPSPIQRGLFVGAVCFLLISVLFSITGIPAADLFSVLGGTLTLGFYAFFVKNGQSTKRSLYARHLTLLLLVAAIILKSFELSVGSFFFLAAFVTFLVWFVWSVLEELPPSED